MTFDKPPEQNSLEPDFTSEKHLESLKRQYGDEEKERLSKIKEQQDAAAAAAAEVERQEREISSAARILDLENLETIDHQRQTPEVKPTKDSLIEGKLVGRAEYENISETDLFENKKPAEVFPWINEPGYGQGMVIAHKGSGKTFFVRQIMQEIPTELHLLDKDKLEYVKTGAENPKMIVLDDLHYLLEAKRLEELNNETPRITEAKILEILDSTVRDALEKNVKIVFISTGTPLDMYDRFSNPKNQEKFLTLLAGCGVAQADINSVRNKKPVQGISKFNGENILRFREKLDEGFIDNLRNKIKANDIPLLQYDSEHKGHLVTPDGHETEGSIGISKKGLKKKDIFIPGGGKPIPVLLARVRELIALAQELGGLNRETLGLDLGTPLNNMYKGEPEKGETIEGRRLANEQFVTIFNKADEYYSRGRWKIEQDYIDEHNRKVDKINEGNLGRMDGKGNPIEPLPRIFKAPESDKDLFAFFLKSEFGIDAYGTAANVLKKRAELRQKGIEKIKVGDVLGEFTRTTVPPPHIYKKGEPNTGEGWVYTAGDISELKHELHSLYFDLTRDTAGDTIAAKLLALKEDAGLEEVERTFLEHSVGQE